MSNFWEWSKDVSFVNRFIFPAPKPSSYNKDSFPDELLFVPPKEKLYEHYKHFKLEEQNKNNGIPNDKFDLFSPKYNALNNNDEENKSSSSLKLGKKNSNKNTTKWKYCDEKSIPCIYIERKYRLSEATHLLLYLHGNAEDLGKCYPIIDYIRMKLPVNILAPEYPGYGVSTSGDANENTVIEMVQNVYEFAISPYGLNIPPSRVIIYGFSIGSAAALSSTNFNVSKVYIPDHYIINKKKKRLNKSRSDSSSPSSSSSDDTDGGSTDEFDDDLDSDDDDEDEEKYNGKNNKNEEALMKAKGFNNAGRKYFLSTFLKSCPHSADEHYTLFDGDTGSDKLKKTDNHYFYTSDVNSSDDGDPFERLPLASLLNILRKGNIEYPTSVNKKELLTVARKNGLIPPLLSCKKANLIRKYSLLIIVCPFASISQVVADKIGVFASYLLSERFKNIEAIKKVHGPLLIIHGKEDSIIPFQHSVELHKMAQQCDIQPANLELLDGCDHNTMDLRKITNIINKFFKHQFNLCKSQKRIQQNVNFYDGQYMNDINNNRNNNNYPKTNHNRGRRYDEFKINIPSYCWLKPEHDGVELTDEDKNRLKRKQEQDDEEYAFNLFMKQLLQHESMQNASASHLQSHQQKKLNKFFGDTGDFVANKNHQNSNTNTNSSSNNNNEINQNNNNDNNNNHIPSANVSVSNSAITDNVNNDNSTSTRPEPEYSLSHALRLSPDDEIVLPNDSGSN